MTGLNLLRTRRFWPLFVMQTLSSFNDNLYRTALLFVIAYKIVAGDEAAAGGWALVAGGLYVLPYFIFSSLAGELADSMDKARLAKLLRMADVLLVAVGAIALSVSSLALMLGVLFCLGIRGVLFGPLKYSILPQHLLPAELLAGTSILQAASIIATISGQIVAALLPYSTTATILVLISIAALGAAAAIPPAPTCNPDLVVRRNLAAGMFELVKSAAQERALFGAILGISWFYALGAVLTSQFPSLVANVIGATESVAAIFLVCFSLGVALGSLGVSRLLKGNITAKLVPVSALALSLFTIDLWLATSGFSPEPDRMSAAGFVSRPDAWRILFDLFAIAAAAGVFAVPLFAILQTAGDPERRARSMAANILPTLPR